MVRRARMPKCGEISERQPGKALYLDLSFSAASDFHLFASWGRFKNFFSTVPYRPRQILSALHVAAAQRSCPVHPAALPCHHIP